MWLGMLIVLMLYMLIDTFLYNKDESINTQFLYNIYV